MTNHPLTLSPFSCPPSLIGVCNKILHDHSCSPGNPPWSCSYILTLALLLKILHDHSCSPGNPPWSCSYILTLALDLLLRSSICFVLTICHHHDHICSPDLLTKRREALFILGEAYNAKCGDINVGMQYQYSSNTPYHILISSYPLISTPTHIFIPSHIHTHSYPRTLSYSLIL